jgi:predicted transcriptional regulator
MQRKDFKTLKLRKVLGEKINSLRKDRTKLSANRFSNEYDIGSGNISRIENAEVDCKFITVWKIADALGLRPSELVKIVETELGPDFKLIDE